MRAVFSGDINKPKCPNLLGFQPSFPASCGYFIYLVTVGHQIAKASGLGTKMVPLLHFFIDKNCKNLVYMAVLHRVSPVKG